MSPAAEDIVERLDAVRQKWWLFTLLTTVVMATCVSFGTFLFFMLTDSLLKFPQAALGGALVTWLGLTLALAVLLFRRLMRSQRSIEATARRIEVELPELGSHLINVVQLSEDSKNDNRAFCDAAVDQSAAQVGRVRFDEAAKKESRWGRFRHCMQTPRDLGESIACLGLLIAVATGCQLLIPNWSSAANRLLKPWDFVPTVGSVQIQNVTPGNTEVLVGSTLDITAQIENPENRPYEARLFVTPEGEAEAELPMAPDEKHVGYSRTLPSILKPFTYRLEIGDSQTKRYTVELREKPTISEIEVTFHYPPYLNRPEETFLQKHADLEAPQCTMAELRIRPSVPIASGHILSEGEHFTGRVEDRGERLLVRMPLLRNTTFTIHLFNEAGHTDPSPRLNRVHVLPDKPPTVELLKPPRQGSAKPGADVPVMIRCGDDHGIDRIRLEMKIKETGSQTGSEREPEIGLEAETGLEAEFETELSENSAQQAKIVPPQIVKEWNEFQGKSTVVLHHRLELATDRFLPGQTVMVRAVGWDARYFDKYGLDLQPQQAASGWHTIRVTDPDVEASDKLEQLDSLRGAIWKILEKQVRTRVRAAMIAKRQDPNEAARIATDVRAEQIDVQKATIGLVKTIGADPQEERQTIKRILNQLAFGEMLEAVQLCDALVKVESLDGFAGPVPTLNEKQDRVIEVLRGLLDIARQAQTEALSEMTKRPGGDLPPDVQEKLKEARDKLDEFLEQQKKVVEASERLAKKPVEDFTEEDEQLLKTLAATESDWAKFMNELNTDLSKLPEQDFANASMLEELNEVQTELKMAEDALLKKTADIAVPLEQLGAEMAEEIQTNLEKWLPDEPDRERWSQEESLSDEGKEAPMAELPGELEDLIGELLEEEEDLFDEMQDVSTSAADSLDKGAGWDAKDGPISNMSAKGVTGNTLPNTSEIGGRAGEGRSGKSSGEFVGDEAVGKGGRKTPSRLTPDPYMAGQIKDHSKDSQGGATGGGKESGEGGEGLEGPAPGPTGDRDSHRLAGKQGALRNKAEAIDLQHFQIAGYHHTDLQEMAELMAQIERDLKAGRYQNALRQRKVVAEKLGNVKQYMEGEFEVRKDETVNLPTEIQKEILGGMQDASPLGWGELNRQYFERLATGGAPEPANEATD